MRPGRSLHACTLEDGAVHALSSSQHALRDALVKKQICPVDGRARTCAVQSLRPNAPHTRRPRQSTLLEHFAWAWFSSSLPKLLSALHAPAGLRLLVLNGMGYLLTSNSIFTHSDVNEVVGTRSKEFLHWEKAVQPRSNW